MQLVVSAWSVLDSLPLHMALSTIVVGLLLWQYVVETVLGMDELCGRPLGQRSSRPAACELGDLLHALSVSSFSSWHAAGRSPLVACCRRSVLGCMGGLGLGGMRGMHRWRPARGRRAPTISAMCAMHALGVREVRSTQ